MHRAKSLIFHAATLLPNSLTFFTCKKRIIIPYFLFSLSTDVANNDSSPPLVSYTELYNSALDHIDLMQDYYVWQNCKHPGQFAYCQYPFVLSILAKRFILTKVSKKIQEEIFTNFPKYSTSNNSCFVIIY